LVTSDRRVAAAAWSVAILVTLTAGATNASTADSSVARRTSSVGRRVLVVGDSLAVGTKPYLRRVLHGWRVRTSATISKHAPEGASELARRSRHLPPVVVASLGTNDDPHAVSNFEHAVRKSLRAVGKHGCLVWPNIVRPAVGGATYEGYNNVLDHLARSHDNLRVVDWVTIAAHNRGWFGDDGVHPNATGYLVRAQAIAKKVRRCRA
jgi:lysophospholipase L1-like esterase